MSKYASVTEFKQWVCNYFQKFLNEDNFVAHTFGDETTKQRGIIIINRNNGKIARSYCHPDDEWDWATGVAVAYAHYMGVEIPKIDKDYFIENLVGKEVKLPANYGTATTVFVTPYKKGGFQIVVNSFTGLSFKVHPHLLIQEHDIKD